jgi:hypothetical protein
MQEKGKSYISSLDENNLRNFSNHSATFIRNLHEKEGWDADRIVKASGGDASYRETVNRIISDKPDPNWLTNK